MTFAVRVVFLEHQHVYEAPFILSARPQGVYSINKVFLEALPCIFALFAKPC